MSMAFLGEIKMFSGTFAPRNWAFCNGQELDIAANSALYSLVGQTYGPSSNQSTKFKLPDLRGRVPLHVGGTTGQGPGLSMHALGEKLGVEGAAMSSAQMPLHNHTATFTPTGGGTNDPLTVEIAVLDDKGTVGTPADNVLAKLQPGSTAQNVYAPATSANAKLGGVTVSGGGGGITGGTVAVATAGASQPFSVMQPFLGLNYIICVAGVYPVRS